MKKYFAKFLPKPGGFQRVVKENGVPVDFEREVQLFLCSKDIKVGDKVQWIEPNLFWINYPHDIVEEIKSTERGSFSNGNDLLIRLGGTEKVAGNWFYMKEFLKVIGPISPEAIWVKEGDEFTDKEVGHSMYDYEDKTFVSFEFISTMNDFSKSLINKEEFIYILCPTCKTFH